MSESPPPPSSPPSSSPSSTPSSPLTSAAAATAPLPSGNPAFKPTIAYDDFAKVDLRVATIMTAEHHPKADRLFRLQVDDGSGTQRQICAGIRGHYEAADLVGKQIIIVANLEPRIIRGESSNGMLLAASDLTNGQEERGVVILGVQRPVPPGSPVS